MEKFLSKHAFWVVQFIGWGSFALLVNLINEIGNNATGQFIALFGFMFIGILITSILRWVLKHYVSLENFKAKDLMIIVVSVIAATAIFPKTAYWYGYLVGAIKKHLFTDHQNIFNRPPADELSDIGKYVGYFIIIGGWTFFYFVIKILRRSNNERIKRLELKKKVKQAQLNTLKGHINPQFMFNSLNNIKGLMLEDVNESRSMLTKLSEMLRYSLTKNNVNAVTLEEEMEMVNNYVSLMQIQYEDRFKLTAKIDPLTQNMEIPPMLVLSLVEHCAKNGVLLQRKGGDIHINLAEEDGFLKITLEHLGKTAGSKESELLIRMVEQRLKLLYGDNAEFLETSNSERTKYLVSFPVCRAQLKTGMQ